METSRVFIKNLPPTITEAEVKSHFGAKGRHVTDVKLIPNRRIAFVGYKSPGEAQQAIKYFDRSFIRMSRISVESAKPISDSNVPVASRTNNDGLSAKIKDPAVERSEPNPKKRKIAALEEHDPKLQEFLEVMNSSQAHKRPREQDRTDPENHVPAPLEEGDSDDEYQAIPSNRPPAHIVQEERDREPIDPAPVPGQVQPEPPDREEPAPREVTKVQVDATDDDWLRSRTSRVLDLLDPDDDPSPAPPISSEGLDQDQPREEDREQPALNVENHEASPGGKRGQDNPLDLIRKTRRIFVRNLSYDVTEDDLTTFLGVHGTIEEVHLPVDAKSRSKGFALVSFKDSSEAIAAFQAADGSTFQGRIIHILPAKAKRDHALDEFALSKLPLKKQNLIRKKAGAATNQFNWNTLFMSQDAVNTAMADRLGVSKSDLLDPTDASVAVKQAVAETQVIQEARAYFLSHGVDLNAFKSQQKGDTAILVKNFPHGTTIEEIRSMFEEHGGSLLRVLMPPSGTIAIVQFAQPGQAQVAFARNAYRKVKDSVLLLEKAPKNLFINQAKTQGDGDLPAQKLSAVLLERDDSHDQPESSSLYVRNLSFSTDQSRFAEAFQPLTGFISAQLKTKSDPKKPGQVLSMGFGFVQFKTKEQALSASKTMDGYVLDGHSLAVKASHRGVDAAEERRREDAAKKDAAQRTKLIIKNLPFQVTKADVRELFGTYGKLKAVRLPKKFNHNTRGFAFAEFVTPREASNALNALKDTHFLGRRLVIDFAASEEADPEKVIEQMQMKIGGQVNKITLQQLTGSGRKRVNIGNEEEDGE
ncbi:hypothetical protein GQ53DRAFT_423245 [Thozetella sp. PMI_491]|nr:hypothetical protein GQ53DRAFT_423245 [Thozetella sp. PMI_491]